MAPLKSLLLLASAFTTTSLAGRTGGCRKDLPPAQTTPGNCVSSHQTDFTQSNGVKRTYRIHIPSNYDKNNAVPLIFSFHGHNKTACGQEKLSEFSNEDWNRDGIVVYPQGLDV